VQTVFGLVVAMLIIWLMWGSSPSGRPPEQQNRFVTRGGEATDRPRVGLRIQR
jgi:hypothetical protein